jgi:zinc protease
MKNAILRPLAAAALLSTALAATAQAQDLPAAADILARYQQALGGSDVLEGRTSMSAVGQFALPAAGLVASFESHAARPDRYIMRIEIPGFGEIRSGYTGEVGWSLNPTEGPRLMSGAEARQTADEAAFESSLRLPSSIASAETVELTRLAGRECYKVRLVWQSGRETYDCYSPETGLLVGTMGQQETAMGTVDAVTLYDDYRVFDGVRMPGRITIQTMGMEQVVTIDDVRFDGVADTTFEPPAQIQALIRR